LAFDFSFDLQIFNFGDFFMVQ